MTAPARTLLVCADDFGLSPGVSRRIVALAQGGRVGATSCLTNLPGWPAQAPVLADAPASLQRGLHLNLSEGRPLSTALARHWPELPSLPRLIVAAHAGRLPLAALADELAAQLGAFEAATGRVPDFIDGHQHVHHLPGVRGLLWRTLATLPATTWVRDTGRLPGPGFALKRWLIRHTGGAALHTALRHRRTRRNPALTGAYDFVTPDYRALVQRWLVALPAEGGLLFCHPGDPDTGGGTSGADGPGATLGWPDPIAAARLREAAYLGSAVFAEDLAVAGVRLGADW